MKVYIVTPNPQEWDSIERIGMRNLLITFSTLELAENYANSRCQCASCKRVIHEVEVDKEK